MAEIEEEALIEAVMRVRSAGAETAAACHEALVLEAPFAALTLSQVKKAASKATKRSAKEPKPPAETAAAKAAAAPPVVNEAKVAKQAKAQATELKSAENAMMDAQRRLRAAKSGGDMGAMAVTVTGTIETFIQQVTAKAMKGVLDPGEERYLKERVEADISALEWVRLAQKAGALRLTEDIVALGGELQLARLKEVRGCRDLPAALACYVRDAQPTDKDDYAAVDKALARTGALATGTPEGTLDDVD